MIVRVTICVGVGEQDTTQGAIESAQNQIRAIDLEELIEIMDYEVVD